MLRYNLFQRWRVFIEVPEIIVLVPALLGLKGNLEMTLASRLSTEANLGNMDDSKEQWSMITANLILVQVSLTYYLNFVPQVNTNYFILSSPENRTPCTESVCSLTLSISVSFSPLVKAHYPMETGSRVKRIKH